MTLTFHWFLSTSGDSRSITDDSFSAGAGRARTRSHSYLTQLALAAEHNGFDSVLTPTGSFCEDAWVTASSLIEPTENLKFLVALRPGQIGPTLSAQMASTFQRLSANRLYLNVVTGGEDAELRAYGDGLNKDERYARSGEFLEILTRLWRGETVDFHGAHLHVEGARLAEPPEVIPKVLFSGSSPAAGEIAARYADTYLTWGEPPAQVGEKITWINNLAAAHGRTLGHGIRFHVISRDTSEEAWAVAERLLAEISPAQVASAQARFRTSSSEGQRRMSEIHGRGAAFTTATTARELEVYPNVWAGVGLVRGHAGTALVGSHREVADRIQEYADLGIGHFIFSGYPNLEESFHVGEGVLPELRRRGVDIDQRKAA